MAPNDAVLAGSTLPGIARAVDRPAMLTEAEFDRLYRSLARPLLRYLTRTTGDTTLAEDLLQKTFIRVLKTTLPSMDERQMKNYLYRIATNLVTDHWRANRKERFLPLFSRNEDAAEQGDADLQADVRKVFRTLKQQERSLLWLAYVEGCRHDEIAEILGVGENSVKVLLFRARKRLGALLREQGLAEAMS
jgi:RNA polymerase sigma-70 factor (ECF subfamily)